MTILNWARANGVVSAARRFGVETSTILRWNRKYKIYSPRPQRTFSLEQKIEILNYAQKYSLTHAMQKYNLEIGTMQNWNKTLHIYTTSGRKEKTIYLKHNPCTSDAHKMRVLQYAKIYGPSAASREYGVPKSTIHLWNNRYNVYKTRAFHKFTDEKKARYHQICPKWHLVSGRTQIPGFDISNSRMGQGTKTKMILNLGAVFSAIYRSV